MAHSEAPPPLCEWAERYSFDPGSELEPDFALMSQVAFSILSRLFHCRFSFLCVDITSRHSDYSMQHLFQGSLHASCQKD